MMKYPPHLLKLIDVLKKLPGVGSKSAERFAFEMISWPEARLKEMAEVIQSTPNKIQRCKECGCLTEPASCPGCEPLSNHVKAMCIVALPRDVFAISTTNEYKGMYHVLGGLLSPLDGIGPDRLNIKNIAQRIAAYQIEEVVIALDSTLEGDTTSLYLKQELEPLQIQVSRLAFGLPMGSSLDYVDGGTLARALSARARF